MGIHELVLDTAEILTGIHITNFQIPKVEFSSGKPLHTHTDPTLDIMTILWSNKDPHFLIRINSIQHNENW